VPTVLGFSPLMQFIHEEDVAEAMARVLETGARGVFNVAGPGAVPLHTAIQETGGMAVPLPEFVVRGVLDRAFRYGLYPFPPGAIDFVKFPCTVDGSRLRQATGFEPLFSLEDTFSSVRR